jgi:hypothetical protein
MRNCILFTFLAIAAFAGMSAGAQTSPNHVKVFLLAGQSNMEGQGIVEMKDDAGKEKPGTLTWMLHDPAGAPFLSHLVDGSGNWAEKKDNVWVYDVSEQGSSHGPLQFGYGWAVGNKQWFGPELQFGHVVGERYKGPILIIKTAWGGRDLHKDFRPPSSGGVTGSFYKEMVETVRKVVGDLKTYVPGYAGGGYDVAGFVWWHGWNDFCDPKNAVPEYEQNLVNLIKDVRHDLNAPRMPVVIGEFTGPWGADCKEAAAVAVRKAQANAAARPEFKRNVLFVETHDFVRDEKQSPSNETYHEYKNGETYFLVGDALGRGMLTLMGAPSEPLYRAQKIEGWTVQVSTLMMEREKDATETALGLLRGQLKQIVRAVPPHVVARLREVTLWFTPGHTGVAPTAEYHPDAGWLIANHRNPAMAKGVEFSNIRIFPAENIRMPWFVLHELAHSYHDRVIGFDNPEIVAAYENAVAGKKYDAVERFNGAGRPNTIERAYAMTNPREYFAESTEAFFGRNDFYPFNREQLHRVDPEIERLLEKYWTDAGGRKLSARTSTPASVP